MDRRTNSAPLGMFGTPRNGLKLSNEAILHCHSTRRGPVLSLRAAIAEYRPISGLMVKDARYIRCIGWAI